MTTSVLVIFLICSSHHEAWRYPFPLPFICTFQSPGETLIATDANLCSVPFPCRLFLPPSFVHLRQDPKNFTIMNSCSVIYEKRSGGQLFPEQYSRSLIFIQFFLHPITKFQAPAMGIPCKMAETYDIQGRKVLEL